MGSNVIDMFSKKNMDDHGQDTEANDALAGKQGRFIGALPTEVAERLTSQMGALNGRNEQITAMSQQWNTDFQAHVAELYAALEAIGMKPGDFDPETQDVAVSKDGKVWVVDVAATDHIH